jgi:hypothetical protein
MITYTDNSQSEEVEPHPELILYFQETQKFYIHFMLLLFIQIQSNLLPVILF